MLLDPTHLQPKQARASATVMQCQWVDIQALQKKSRYLTWTAGLVPLYVDQHQEQRHLAMRSPALEGTVCSAGASGCALQEVAAVLESPWPAYTFPFRQNDSVDTVSTCKQSLCRHRVCRPVAGHHLMYHAASRMSSRQEHWLHCRIGCSTCRSHTSSLLHHVLQFSLA